MKTPNKSLEEMLPRHEENSSSEATTPRIVKKSKTAKYVFIAIVAIVVLTVLFLAIKQSNN